MTPELPRVYPFRAEERNARRWRWVLRTDLHIWFPQKDWGRADIYDERGNMWLRLRGPDWFVCEGYAWDGCSPKFRVGPVWLGTPDFRSTLAASCWHDSSGQFRHLIGDRLGGREWHDWFAAIITAEGGPGIARLYRLGLAIGNPIYQRLGKPNTGGRMELI